MAATQRLLMSVTESSAGGTSAGLSKQQQSSK
jgi:hypothetical protein